MPNTNAQPAAPAAPAGAQLEAAGRGVQRAAASVEGAAAQTVAKAGEIGGKIRKLLRFEATEPQQVGIAKTPFYALGHAADGTILNIGRRINEIVEPQLAGIRATIGLSIGNILSPLETLKHPINRIYKKSIRAITSQVQSAVNMILSPVRATHELLERGVSNTMKQVNFQTQRVLGPLSSKPTALVTFITDKVAGSVRKALDWVVSPVTSVHEAVAPA